MTVVDRLFAKRGIIGYAAMTAWLIALAAASAEEPESVRQYRASIQKHIERAEKLTTGSGLKADDDETAGDPGDLIMPAGFQPWWQTPLATPLTPKFSTSTHSISDLYGRALVHSSQVKAFSDIPLIRETAIQEAEGIFDLRGFVEAKYDDTKEPVGSLLVTAVNRQFLQQQGVVEAGVRKRLETGADVSISQRSQVTRSNSEFLAPNPQSLTTLAFTAVQPLLRNAGVAYNRSVLHIAKLDTEIAEQEFMRQAQSHLMEVTRAYWALYLARGTYVQQKRLVEETADIVERIKQRAAIDTVTNQQVRAESALASRKSDVIRSELAIRNAEDRLRALLDDPQLLVGSSTEIIPDTPPIITKVDTGTRATAVAALENRPEIAQGFKRLKATAIRQDVAKSDLLPQLNLILEGRLKGLAPNHGIGSAISDEFNQGSYLVGLSFEVPFENNQAEARKARREIEARQLTSQLDTTIETILLEVKVSVRALHTAYKEMQAKYATLVAAEVDLKTLRERWGLFAEGAPVGFGDTGGSFLEFLLNAQSRVSQAQSDLLAATVDYNVAITNLERAKGTLLKYDHIHMERAVDARGLPVLQLRRDEVPTAKTPSPRAHLQAVREHVSRLKADPEITAAPASPAPAAVALRRMPKPGGQWKTAPKVGPADVDGVKSASAMTTSEPESFVPAARR